MEESFVGKLDKRIEKVNSLLCVGLDPHSSDIQGFYDTTDQGKNGASEEEAGAEAAFKFCERLINETKHIAACYKPNSAFFEVYGSSGMKALERVIATIPDDIPVILDSKRGDISTTADAYATAAFKRCKAGAVTVHPYMGIDSVDPFAKYASHGVFVLCKTSNPSSNDFETLVCQSHSTTSSDQSATSMVYEVVARKAEEWNAKYKNIGIVVGATDVVAMKRSRALAPTVWILAPGVGFQGGDLEATTEAGIREDGSGLLIPVSRGISRASSPKEAAEKLNEQINQVRQKVMESRSSESKKIKAEDAVALTPAEIQRNQFFDLALSCGVLKFGQFTLKSGRISPYFFNAGMFHSGKAVSVLSKCYAGAIVRNGLKFDCLFGPAYKGISLASSVVAALYSEYGMDVPYAYNRKEEKTHGEGGSLVGASMEGKKVLIIDDVITAGTAIRESMTILKNAKAIVVGVIVALDRQERADDSPSSPSAIQSVRQEFGIEAFAIATLNDLLKYAASHADVVGGAETLSNIQQYREKYGTKIE